MSTPKTIEERMRILQLAADGLTYPDMAKELGLSAGTVKNQGKELLDILGADNLHHAVALGFRRKLIL